MESGSGRLNQANGRLKAAKVGVRIEQIGKRLYLVATLPPKPGAKKLKPHQQKISLGVYANPAGISSAEKEARKVGALIACKEFDWGAYLTEPVQNEQLLVKDWVEQLERDYFTRRAKTPKSETTWTIDYLRVFKRLLSYDEALTPEILQEAIEATEPDTRSRKRACIAMGAIAKFAGIEFDAKAFAGSYSPKRVAPRDLPDDKVIAETFYQIQNDSWRWVYGMLAAYGLRPHEVFLIDVDNLDGGICSLLDGKTGARRVWAIYPEWVQEFDLANIQMPDVSGRSHSDLGHRVSVAFKRLGIPFKPYDLRHCWAIRSLEFGLDISLAAQQMGHSVQVHTDLYHHWISDRHHQRAYEVLMARSARPRPPV